MQRTALAAAILAAFSLAPARAGLFIGGEPDYSFETQLDDFELTGSITMPLSGDGEPQTEDGYGYMNVGVTLRQSASVPSLGRADAFDLGGGLYQVDSFYDVVFDLLLEDIDPFADFAGSPAGATLSFLERGPVRIESSWTTLFNPLLPNGGLWPPAEDAPYTNNGVVSIPLGVDINGNGSEDKLRIDDLLYTWLNPERKFVFVPTRVVWTMDTIMAISGGVHDIVDPPFGPLMLTGPTTASAELIFTPVPEPGSLAVLGFGFLAVWRRRRH